MTESTNPGQSDVSSGDPSAPSGPLWIVAAARGGSLEKVTLELLGDGRKLASSLGLSLEMVVMGTAEETATAAEEFRQYGDETVRAITHPDLAGSTPETLVPALKGVVEEQAPQVIMIPATANGRVIAPCLAAHTGMGFIPHCLTLKSTRSKLSLTRVSHGGRVHQSSTWPVGTPLVVTMKPGVGDPVGPLDTPADGETHSHTPQLPKPRVKVVEEIPPDPKTQDITESERLVAGGRGVGSKEGFKVVEELADALDASVAASRVVVDLGWIEHARQVGQTGKTVTPKLYIAVGISGASHHLSGMKGSEKIVAVNHDKKAPIFEAAHFGTVGDLHEVLPRLTEKIRQEKKGRDDEEQHPQSA